MPSYVRAGIRKCARIRALSMPGNIMLVHAQSQTQQHAERTVGKRATDPRNRPVLKRIRQIERTGGSPSSFID